MVLGVRVSCKGRLRECDHQLQLLEELSVEKGIIFPLLFILVDKVREQVLEWASPFKYDLVPSPGEQDGHAAFFFFFKKKKKKRKRDYIYPV